MEVLGEIAQSPLSGEEIRALIPTCYADAVVKCFKVPSETRTDQFNLLAITNQGGHVVEFSPKGAILRTSAALRDVNDKGKCSRKKATFEI